jgi:hypothetical protein
MPFAVCHGVRVGYRMHGSGESLPAVMEQGGAARVRGPGGGGFPVIVEGEHIFRRGATASAEGVVPPVRGRNAGVGLYHRGAGRHGYSIEFRAGAGATVMGFGERHTSR